MFQQPYVLGLDIGSNSIGWALLRKELNHSENNLITCGVRVFPAGTMGNGTTSETSKTAERRTARGMRRQLERRSRRKTKLKNALIRHGFLSSAAQVKSFSATDPYELRSRGLDQDLTPEEFARALLHLNQKRGFKSNRRTGQDSESKIVGKGIDAFKAQMAQCKCHDDDKCRTVGQYFHRHVPLNSDRRRNRKANEISEARFYFDRKMVRHEFDALWTRQKQTHPNLCTEAAYNDIAIDCIFFQRPFEKPGTDHVGRCSLEKTEPRARQGHRLVHRFRILNDLQNIRLETQDPVTGRTISSPLSTDQRRTLENQLASRDQLKLKDIPKILSAPHAEVNLTRGEREIIGGNSTEKTLLQAFASTWLEKSEDEKNEICHFLLEEEDHEVICRRAELDWGLDRTAIDTLLKHPLKPQKHGNLSLKAIKTLLPGIEQGERLDEAIEKCYPDRNEHDEPFDLLPFPPGTCFFSQHSKKGRSPEQDERVRAGAAKAAENRLLLGDDFLPITNPVVKKALFETRRVVNQLIRKYGKPAIIRVELARDTKGSIDQRNDRAKDNAERRKEKERLVKEIKSILATHCNQHREPTGTDILKFRLYQECEGKSAYSGKDISLSDLFSGAVHVDHIIPFSRSLDDSSTNKVLCFHDENAAKGNQTPYEWIGHNEQMYHEMLERVRRFRCSDKRTWRQKLSRFEQKELKPLDDFIARKLTDTQYISRQVHQYLQCLYPQGPHAKKHVQIGRGQTTSTLRHLWGLDGILWELNEIPYEEQSVEKNRTDHRHHAIDAIVIALTSPSTLKQFSTRQELRYRNGNGEKKPYPTPWAQQSEFREHIKEAVRNIIVSHASTRKIRGALHQETLYGKAEAPDTYTIYKPVLGLTKNQIDCIVDDRVRKLVLGVLTEAGVNWQTASERDVQMALKANQAKLRFPMRQGQTLPCPIRRVKLKIKASKPIAVQRSNGEDAYVTPGSNHHVEIFEWTEHGKIVRDIVSITRYEAARRVRCGLPVVSKQHPSRPEAEFLMSLCNNDVVELRYRGGPPEICRLQKQSVTEGKNRSTADLSFRIVSTTATDNTKNSPGWRRVRNLDPAQFDVVKIELSALGEIVARNVK